MFKWFNDMRMGAKLLVSFAAVVVLVGGALGGLGYVNLNTLNAVVLNITEQRVPSVKNATAVERYALRTIMDEKQYLYYAYDVNVDASQFQASAMANLDEIIAALDEVDKVATEFNDQDLLAKSQEVRTVTLEYRDLYNEGAAKLQENKQLADELAAKGAAVTAEAQAYYESKVGLTDAQSIEALKIVVNIWDTALQTRLNARIYMQTKDAQAWTTVQENLELGAYLRRDAAAVEADMEKGFVLFPRLKERRKQMAGTLSGGEQQMLAIARALLSRPRLLLLDEPSLGLAPQVTEAIFRTLREVNAQGVSILLVEQNAHLALNFAHYGYVLETGEVVMAGPGKALLGSAEVRKAYLGE